MPSHLPLPKAWLLDYDLTLYGQEERWVLDHLDANITSFVQDATGLSRKDSDALRKELCALHGTTLAGMRVRQGTDPDSYFDFIHNGPGPLPMPSRSPLRRQVLEQLPGELWIFTNGRRDWAERGLVSMGLADLFGDRILDIRSAGWRGKPDPSVYEFAQKRVGQRGTDIAMVDDHPGNLVPADKLGWTAVLCHPEPQSGWNGARISAIEELPNLFLVTAAQL